MAMPEILKTPAGFLKMVEIAILLVMMGMFFSVYNGWVLFVSVAFVGAFVHSFFILIIYMFGFLVIQKTLWEVLLNFYHGIMLLTSAVVIYCKSKESVAISAASIALIATTAYIIDTYIAVKNTGVLEPQLGGQAPQSAPGPVSTSSNPTLKTPSSDPHYPEPLGIPTSTSSSNSRRAGNVSPSSYYASEYVNNR